MQLTHLQEVFLISETHFRESKSVIVDHTEDHIAVAANLHMSAI